MNIKKITKLTASALLLSCILGQGTMTHAKAWYMALAPHCVWRAKDAPDLRDNKEYPGTAYGYVKLDKIYDADSYTILVKAVKSPNENLDANYNTFSETKRVKQG